MKHGSLRFIFKIIILLSIFAISIFYLIGCAGDKASERFEDGKGDTGGMAKKTTVNKLLEYEEVGEESEGMIAVKRNGYWGYVNSNHDLVTDIVFDEC